MKRHPGGITGFQLQDWARNGAILVEGYDFVNASTISTPAKSSRVRFAYLTGIYDTPCVRIARTSTTKVINNGLAYG